MTVNTAKIKQTAHTSSDTVDRQVYNIFCSVIVHNPVLDLYLYKPKYHIYIYIYTYIYIHIYIYTYIYFSANLSDSYFTDRQDRYVVISQCKHLADYFEHLIGILSSLRLQPDNSISLSAHAQRHPYLGQ